ncbi:plastidial pyruvate kinase 1 [Pyrus ussuriensis x Pyrus communis]|uniref:Plastidial pyruvate kinase 1 n=1 Tax=Pyrus ussuriensis x Pyrus communis TaxID=2448454 RepID=A0A5N5GBA9_9ROSA|nr:plastidial pyruvate kinase 1 [Pyrus ussuriensis x Pyrus communis]
MHAPSLLTVLGKLSSVHSFAKCFAYSRRSFLITTMHETLILVTEFMCAEVALVAQLRTAAEKIKKLEFELAVLKGSYASAPLFCSWSSLIKRSPI